MLTLHDLSGRLVLQQNAAGRCVRNKPAIVAKGVYIVTVTTGKRNTQTEISNRITLSRPDCKGAANRALCFYACGELFLEPALCNAIVDSCFLSVCFIETHTCTLKLCAAGYRQSMSYTKPPV